jgi:4'-phosphopantetheinyl transferase
MSGAIHIAVAGVAPTVRQAAQGGLAWLSVAEQDRLARITAAARRDQFIAGRWLARQVLAAAGGGEPSQWGLSAPDDGPPLARGPRPGFHVGLSHSGDLVACAAAPLALGLDLELPRRPRDFLALAEAICSAREREELHAAPVAARELLFYRFWTLKEAWLKSRGEAMSPGRMAQVHTDVPSDEKPACARVWQVGGMTLALVAPVDAQVLWLGDAPGTATAWAIKDAKAASSRPG